MGSSEKANPQGQAILDWINELQIAQASQAVTFESLLDGRIVWSILNKVDAKFFTEDLPEGSHRSGKWLAYLQNLKYIYKTLGQYIVERHGRSLSNDFEVDLEAVARGESQNDLVKLLKMVVFVAVHCDDNAEYVRPMMSLSPDKQEQLQHAIVELRDVNTTTREDESSSHNFASSISDIEMDKDLFYEEKLGQLIAENQKLQHEKKEHDKGVKDALDRNNRLHENNAILQQKLAAVEDHLKQAASSSVNQSTIKELESRTQRQDDLIGSQEVQILEYQRRCDLMQSEVNRFRGSQEKLQAVQDQLDEIRVERDSLARKANTLDKYKQKLQRAQDLEREAEELRNALEEARQQARDIEQSKERALALKRDNDQYKQLIPKIEIDLHESQMMRQQLDRDVQALHQQLRSANEQHTRDQEAISELVHQSESVQSPRSSIMSNLDSELAGETRRTMDANSRLPGNMNEVASQEVQKMRSENLELLQKLEDLNNKTRELERRYSLVYQEKAALESNIKTKQSEANLTRHEHPPKHKSHAHLHSSANANRKLQSLPKIEEQEASDETDEQALEISRMIRETMQRLADQTENLELRDHDVQQLKDQLSQLPGQHSAQVDKADYQKLRKEKEILEREHRLMTTAFFELSSRHQLNSVSIQRRSDPPKSFLNRQRQLVNQATAIRLQ